jgi:hypothetical protein
MSADSILKTSLRSPKKALCSALQFLTTWAIIIHILAWRCHRLRHTSVVLAVLVSIGGAYITYIYPRRISVDIGCRRFAVTGPALCVTDYVTHQLPLLIVLCVYARRDLPHSATTLLPLVVVLMLYAMSFDVTKKYELRPIDLFLLFLVVSVVVKLFFL